MQRMTEQHFQTREQVCSYLMEALTLVDELAPPDDLRVAFFQKAVDLVAGKQVFFEQVNVAPPGMIVPTNKRH